MPDDQTVGGGGSSFMRKHQPKLLALDNDDEVLQQIARVIGGYYLVLQVRNPRRAMGLLEIDPDIRVFITEQVMRSADGVELLASVRSMRPDVRRIMLTTYTDLAAIVAGLHSGAVQCLVQKPVSDSELLGTVCPEIAARTALPVAHRISA